MKKLIASVLCAALFCGSMTTAFAAKKESTIKVGLLYPATGAVAQYGMAVHNGAMMYLDELNAAGGINGKKVEVVKYDEEGDPTKAVTGYNSLADAGVTAIIGDVTTAPTIAVVAASQDDNMPMITASATAESVTYNAEAKSVYHNMFRSCFIDPFQGKTMSNFAAKELGLKKAAVLYDNGDTYSTGVYETFVAQCKENGMEVVAVESYASGAKDYSSQLTNIAAANPDVLFLPIYYNDVALVATQAADAGLKVTMLGVDGWDTVLEVVPDTSLLEGAYFCSGYSIEDTSEAVQTFLAAYGAKYNGDVPNMFAAQAYDAAKILCDALAVAESKGLKTGSDDYKEAVIEAISATDADFVTGHVTFDEYNNPQKDAAIIHITGGQAKFWGKY